MNEYIERTNAEREKALSECPPNSGYNIVPMTATPASPDAPVTQPEPKPRTFGLFFCGLQWSVIAGIVMFFTNKNGNVFPWAAGVLLLASAIAAIGLVWGVFQHVLKTIVRIVRTK